MYLSVKEVSKIFKCGVETVRRWISEGKLKAVKLNNHYKIEKNSLYNLVSSNNTDAEDESKYIETIIEELK